MMLAPDIAVTTLDRAHIARMVARFYGDVRTDALLGPVFAPRVGDRWDAHLVRMTDFWCAAMKLERGFRGDVYARHMAVADLRREHLYRWLWLWYRDTAIVMAPADAARMQRVAIGIARVFHLGWFGTLPPRAELERAVALHGAPCGADYAPLPR